MSEKAKRDKLKQYRIMRYFVDASIKIIKEEGISAITIRKVSNYAGYTSATLYNYFDSLEHLVFLANMDSLEEYVDILPTYIEDCKNSIEVYMGISTCYVKHAYENPETFYSLFFSHKGEKYEQYTKQYYELYPERDNKSRSEFLNKLFHINNLYERRLYLLSHCIKDDFITEENAKEFTDICLRFYKTVICDVKEGILNKKEATALTFKYEYKLLGFYINSQHKDLIDKYQKKTLNYKLN